MKKNVTISDFGFAVTLIDCPHIMLDGEWTPKINFKLLEEAIFVALPFKPSRLTGAEVKFIRRHLDMTQSEFGKWLDEPKDSTTIVGWEKTDLEPTKMDEAQEKSLRLQLMVMISAKKRRKTIDLPQTLKGLTLSIRSRIKRRIDIDGVGYTPMPHSGLSPDYFYA